MKKIIAATTARVTIKKINTITEKKRNTYGITLQIDNQYFNLAFHTHSIISARWYAKYVRTALKKLKQK